MSKGLSNDDFRKLMMTPRTTEVADFSSQKTKKKSSKKRTHRFKGEEFDEFSWTTEGVYRDRAAERRDMEKSGEDGPQDSSVEPNSIIFSFHNIGPPEQMDLKEQRQKSIEESKFLGGDIDHTHLVKGLDEALYRKTMEEMKKKEEMERKEKEEEEEQKRKEKEITTSVADRLKQKKKITFYSSIARSVHFQLFGNEIPKINDNFLPGRTAFTFDLHPNSTKDIPDVNVHFRDECLRAEDYAIGRLDSDIMKEIKCVISAVREGRHQKRQIQHITVQDETKKVEEKKVAIEDTEEEEDIFDIKGEYVPDEEIKQAKEEQAGSKQAYFETSAFDEKESKQEASLPEVIKKLEQQQKQVQREIEMPLPENKKSEPTYTDDGYDECYPGTYEGNFVTYEESDEEDDVTKMDMGKKNKMRRSDFASEEAWGSYNDSREAMPRAAFQFGVKMNAGRKTRKNEGKNKEKKLDKELKKINSMIRNRENMKSSVPTAQELKRQKRQ